MSAVIWLPYIYLSHINRHYDANTILCKVAHIDIIMTYKEKLRLRAETLLCLLCLSLFDSFKLSVRFGLFAFSLLADFCRPSD